MQITVRRAEQPLRGTHWRPIEHTVERRRSIESVRREMSNGPDKMIRRLETHRFNALSLLANSDNEYTAARIESQYRRGEFVEGFVYVRGLAAFIHEDEVATYEQQAHRISPGVVIAKAVKIEEGAHIGPYVELERGAQVLAGATVRDHSVVRKGAVIGEDVAIGAHVHIGQFDQIAYDVSIRPMSVIERDVRIGSGTKIGTQDVIGAGTDIGPGSLLADSVRVGRNANIGAEVVVNEMTVAGDNLTIGDGTSVGAESRFGSMVRVAKNLLLLSPTYASDGESILESNLRFTFRPEQN